MRQISWDFNAPDLLPNYLASLPDATGTLTSRPQPTITRQNFKNAKNGEAELITLSYEEFDSSATPLYHGTTPAAVRGILANGLKDSGTGPRPDLHEHSAPGLYTSLDPFEAMGTYAVSTLFDTYSSWQWNTPYCRFVLVLQAYGAQLRKQRGTECLWSGRDLRLPAFIIFNLILCQSSLCIDV